MVTTFVTVWELAYRSARVASGQLAATPPRSVMKSRRLMLAARLGSITLALRWPLCATANCGVSGRLRVNCTYYRAAALLSASPQLAESIRGANRFRVVPAADKTGQFC